MKIKSLFLLSVMAFCTIACDKKENEPTETDITGNYTGYTLASCAYFQNTCSADETISIATGSDGSTDVSFSSDSWGEFTITDIQKSVSDNIYTLSGSGQTQMGMEGNISSYDCTFTAEIESKEKARMQFKVPAVMGGLTIEFITGEAPAHLLLAGTYKGYSDADCTYFQNRYTDNESMTLTANDDETISISFESALWGNFNVSSATVVKQNDQYTFSGSGTVAMGMGDSTSNYDFTMTGTTNAAKDSFSIVFNIPAVMGGLTITLLPGNAPSSNGQ